MLTGGGTSASGTDTDNYAESLKTKYGISSSEAVILANNHKLIETVGVEGAMKELGISAPRISTTGFSVVDNN